MSYKTITLIVTDRSADSGALAAAIALSRREGAHLEVHCIGIDLSHYESLPMAATGVLLDSMVAEARANADSLANWVAGELPPDLAGHSVQKVVAPQLALDTTVSRLARYSDLVIAAKPYGQSRNATQVTIVEAALFSTGAPVLIVPEAGHDWSRPFSRIAVAWNESDVSFTALRRALPLLKAADLVDLVIVDPPAQGPDRADPGSAISVALARHGVHAQVSILARTLPRVSEVITRFAQEQGADLIVMGAYGHSRFREAILGGATREMLETAPLPLFMAH